MFRKFLPIIAAVLSMSACTSRHEAAEAPLIGISCGISAAGVNTLHDSYVQAIACAGGIPVIVPVLTDSAAVASVLEHLDGIVFSGGEDFDPALYGEEIIPDAGVSINAIRDTSDLLYARGALAASIPVLGICRGCQLMNVAAGGTLYQDLPVQKPSELNHRDRTSPGSPVHLIAAGEGSFLRTLYGRDTIGVNSLHHQAVKDLAGVYTLSAVATDGVVEAFENGTVYAVQFHPEKLLAAGYGEWKALFDAFIERCRK